MKLFMFYFLFPSMLTATCVYEYKPTLGEVWPAPAKQVKERKYLKFESTQLKFKVTSWSCSILDKAIIRYTTLLQKIHEAARSTYADGPANKTDDECPYCSMQRDTDFMGNLEEVQIELTNPCEGYPHLNMDESYTLNTGSVSKLKSDSIWGVLRGLETFSQLLYLSNHEVRMNRTSIIDYPRYPHRGLLLDTSRHFISLENIKMIIDGMSMNKMNVFHWHIVDDPSFPYQSETFPELSEKGAFNSTMVYTRHEIQRLINYARHRGIRVVPEFDVPGHTASWGAAYPNILTPCFKYGAPDGSGPMNPINNATYKLIEQLFKEVQHLFPDKYFHVGGDEVNLDCWSSNPTLSSYMHKNGISSVEELHGLFMKNTIPLLRNLSTPIVWQEVYDNGVHITNDTVVQVWKYGDVAEMKKVLSSGKKVLFSSAWYLDEYLGLRWEDFYKVDPRLRAGVVDNLENIIGGETCMWSENVEDQNVVKMIWPRACAVAERLWTDKEKTTLVNELARIPPYIYNRLEEQRCRMISRGIETQSISVGSWSSELFFGKMYFNLLYFTMMMLVLYGTPTNIYSVSL